LLAESADGDKPLTMHELQNLMNQPITGGYTTTADSIENAMLLLLDHPDHMERPRPVRCSRAACTFVSDSNWPSGK
jgi:cytochrome P450